MIGPVVRGMPTIQPLMAGPHLRPARLASPISVGAMKILSNVMKVGIVATILLAMSRIGNR